MNPKEFYFQLDFILSFIFIQFQEDSEKSLAQMYRKVALSSLKHADTINSYQRAIEGLSVSILSFNCIRHWKWRDSFE